MTAFKALGLLAMAGALDSLDPADRLELPPSAPDLDDGSLTYRARGDAEGTNVSGLPIPFDFAGGDALRARLRARSAARKKR